jgi:hypothetical protein
MQYKILTILFEILSLYRLVVNSSKFPEWVKQKENIETFTVQTNNLADYKENRLLSKDERK